MPRLPEYLKRNIIDTEKTKNVRKILKENCLNTVCDGARCPNKNECYQKNTATFLIMGNVCTRNCRYCNIGCEKPLPLDENEPKNLAKAVRELGLKYVVITSVTRDDLPDGGAEHFGQCIKSIRGNTPSPQSSPRVERKNNKKEYQWGEGVNVSLREMSETNDEAIQKESGWIATSLSSSLTPRNDTQTKIEILTPDFKGDTKALDKIINSPPDVFNHNIEVVEDIFKKARPQGDYRRSLEVLKYVKENSNITTKSGLMVGLGETFEQIEQTLTDLKNVGCDIVTIGQYIPPSKKHFPLDRFYSLEEFEQLKALARKVGIKNYQIGPLVRSSYNAAETASSQVK